ncbi:hypothetical protein RDI58_018444 [Solanum bulbocastanum]|uniref:Uncharacterized protein n=1 Tax=Solanum bulbocastanum TaxID=147425 RepID=A0AAN8Y9R8_SOLBU
MVSLFRNNPSSILEIFQEAIATNTNSYQQSQVNTVYSSNSKDISPTIQNCQQTHLPPNPKISSNFDPPPKPRANPKSEAPSTDNNNNNIPKEDYAAPCESRITTIRILLYDCQVCVP